MDSELLLKFKLGISQISFDIVAYAFTLFLDNLCRNSSIRLTTCTIPELLTFSDWSFDLTGELTHYVFHKKMIADTISQEAVSCKSN